MALRSTPLVVNETYHLYNRGAHKQPIFLEERDYQRFLALLYLANSTAVVDLRQIFVKYKGESFVKVFECEDSDKVFVDIMAYSLLPNHFHVVARQKRDGGISTLMKKLGTGYSMYFNAKYDHGGTLFQGPFGSSHLDTDPYFKWIFPYVHLNPVSIVEPQWQEKGITDPARAKEFLKNYRYSSYYDYYVSERPERAILAYDETSDLLDKESDIQSMLSAYAKGRVLYQAVEKKSAHDKR